MLDISDVEDRAPALHPFAGAVQKRHGVPVGNRPPGIARDVALDEVNRVVGYAATTPDRRCSADSAAHGELDRRVQIWLWPACLRESLVNAPPAAVAGFDDDDLDAFAAGLQGRHDARRAGADDDELRVQVRSLLNVVAGDED